MATILAHIQVKPGCEGRFEAIAGELFRATAEGEAACRHYEYFRGQKPGFYYCLLAFDDFRAFIDHQTSDHHEAASPKLGDLMEDIRLEWLDPVGSASSLPSTEMQSVRAGANELTTRYHELFAAQLADWWAVQRG